MLALVWVCVCVEVSVWVLEWIFWSLWTVKSERAGIDYSFHSVSFVLVCVRVYFVFHSKSHSNCCLYTWKCFDCRFTCCYCCHYAAGWLAVYQGVVVTCACKWKRHSYCFSVDMCVFFHIQTREIREKWKKFVWNSMLHALRRRTDFVKWMLLVLSKLYLKLTKPYALCSVYSCR